MPHSHSFTALVLKTYDVGEADRYCVFLTKEQGRISARASGARRPKSRLGGALLPFRQVTVELKEGAAGWIICGVAHRESDETISGVAQFMQLEEGVELLLRLVSHEGEVPEIYEATREFFDACARGERHAALGYTFALLHHLGLMPGEEEMEDIGALSAADQGFINQCRGGRIGSPGVGCDLGRLLAVKSFLVDGQLTSPLRTEGVMEAML